ncbi:protein boule-like [Papio anubis]|nr:protein boule-like [Papio anubis]
MPAAGTMYLTTSTGYPYTYHNGVAYFHTPEVTSVPPPWPSRSVCSSPVMVAQPIYQQPAYHYQATAQYLPGQWQWSVPQPPASSAPFLYLQPSEVIYQPVEIAQDGGCVPPPLSLMETSVPELHHLCARNCACLILIMEFKQHITRFMLQVPSVCLRL